ncbi:hypothetical protein V498_04584 [Pseudogymnoascus sp. VKM F-4517 (FW-2822)]|nr:hypothetical protein V498_04584 [Pseudogymnoascus sp. VKM F-4517 (FW-2822)]
MSTSPRSKGNKERQLGTSIAEEQGTQRIERRRKEIPGGKLEESGRHGLRDNSTYSKAKDIITGPIPKPFPEPALHENAPDKCVFSHFVDDDMGGARTFEDLFQWLWMHYFPLLVWSKFTLNPRKVCFFTSELHILGFTRTLQGICPSTDKLAALKNIKSPTSEEELLRTDTVRDTVSQDLTTIMTTALTYETRVLPSGQKQKHCTFS